MKQIELKKMDIRNFKGIDSLTVDFGLNTDIYGDNATGKTSIYDAFTWLLFGKDSTGATDFEIKPLNSAGLVRNHEAVTEVTAELEVDGDPVTLTKKYKEKWKKPRGAAQAVFSGNETGYAIDEIPKKQNEYTAQIKEIIAEDKFRLLSDVEAFERLNWKDRRNIIMSVCGEPTTEEVLVANPDLIVIKDLLAKYSTDDIKKVYTDKRRTINAEREAIPQRIDENLRIMDKDAEEIDVETARASLKSLEDNLAEAERRKLAMEQGDAKAAEIEKLRAKLREWKLKNKEYQAEQYEQYSKDNAVLQQKRTELESILRSTELTIIQLKDGIITNINSIKHMRKEYSDIRAQQWTGDTVCPTCGQQIPEDKIKESIEAFNRAKSEKLTLNTAAGQKLSEQIKIAEDELKAWEEQRERLQTELKTLPSNPPYFPSDMYGYAKMKEYLLAQIDETENAPEDKTKSIALEQINAEIMAQQEIIGKVKTKIFAAEQTAKQRARIEELKAKEKTLAAELEQIEGVLYATEQFVRTKVKLIEDNVGTMFSKARFKMFKRHIEGSISECCEITYNGVPYDSLNNAAKINIGIDIINTLAEHYETVAPVWIDNAESVTSIEPSDGQQIRLIVSAQDEELRIENTNKLTEVA